MELILDVGESVDDMEAFIQFVHLSEEGKSGLIKPVITPRVRR